MAPIRYTGQAEVQRDIENFKAALARVGVAEGFLPVAAPASVIPDRRNEHYASDEKMLEAIADAMRVEYRAIVDAGLLLQLDDARAAVTYDRMVPPASFADYRQAGSSCRSRPSTTPPTAFRTSGSATTCAGEAGRGRTPPTCRSKDIVDLVLRVRAGAYLIEAREPAP